MAINFTFKNLRKMKRISQQNLAIRLGVSQAYLNQIENNTYKKSPTVELIDRIAQELGACFLDIIECNNNCEKCRHRLRCNKKHNDNDEDVYFFI